MSGSGTVLDAGSIYNTLRNGPPEARKALLEQLPNSDFAEAALLMTADEPGMIICGMTPVVMKLCNGIDPAAGTPLALATHRYAVETFEGSANHGGLLPTTLSNLAHQYAHGCNLLGQSDETLSFTKEWIAYYTELGETQNLPSLKAERINALINARRLEDAQEALTDPTLRGNWATDIEIARLENLLADLLADIGTDKDKGKDRLAKRAATGILTPEVKNALFQALGMAIDDPVKKQQIEELLAKRLENAKPTDSTTAAGLDSLLEAMRVAERTLTGGVGADSEITISRRVREAAGIFVGGRQPPAERIQAALADLEHCLAWAQTREHIELRRDAWWGIAICHGRLQHPSEAADSLLLLRADLEAERAQIKDPRKRGGILSRYPPLFSVLCEKLQLAGRTKELLEAIEASKGRGVADILTHKAERPVEDASIYSSVERLPQLTAEHAFHYMTFHVNDERTYVGFVSKRGDIHAIPPIPVGHATIRDAALHACPGPGGDTARALAPLVEWIADLHAEGVIEAGDHICYAPDEDLSNVPLHYLIIDDNPLIDLVSVSRIHSAFHLTHVLEASAAPPKDYLAFIVPSKQNIERPSWPELQRLLREPAKPLAKLLAGQSVEETDSTIEYVRAVDLRRHVLHFSAHGMFPGPKGGTPFQESGVVLSGTDGLPDANRLKAGDLTLVLTPSKVLDFGLNMTGSHVSIMSCVSGLSREGIGGDALGLDWAFTQAGASSLLTSHWDVNAQVAAPFVRQFYEFWLGKRMSRARALASVMSAFRAKHDPFNQPESWAAFSLTGDWR